MLFLCSFIITNAIFTLGFFKWKKYLARSSHYFIHNRCQFMLNWFRLQNMSLQLRYKLLIKSSSISISSSTNFWSHSILRLLPKGWSVSMSRSHHFFAYIAAAKSIRSGIRTNNVYTHYGIKRFTRESGSSIIINVILYYELNFWIRRADWKQKCSSNYNYYFLFTGKLLSVQRNNCRILLNLYKSCICRSLADFANSHVNAIWLASMWFLYLNRKML